MNSLSLAALITHHNVVHQSQVLKTTVQEGTLRNLHHTANTIRMEGAIPFVTGQAVSPSYWYKRLLTASLKVSSLEYS